MTSDRGAGQLLEARARGFTSSSSSLAVIVVSNLPPRPARRPGDRRAGQDHRHVPAEAVVCATVSSWIAWVNCGICSEMEMSCSS